jgi:GT2 family glycosyltransferase
MLIKREVLAAVGPLPEAYFFGKEEWEYSFRAAKAGFRVLYNPKMIVYHEASHSHCSTDPAYVYNGTLSHILFRKRNNGHLYYGAWILLYTLYLRFLFPIRFVLRKNRYIKGIKPGVIREAMLRALEDSKKTRVITRELLDTFRMQLLSEN